MHIEITQVIVVFVTLLSAVITGIVFPLIRSKVSAARWESVSYTHLLVQRIHKLLPELMEETGYDMWIILCREYNEDPVFTTMLPSLCPVSYTHLHQALHPHR